MKGYEKKMPKEREKLKINPKKITKDQSDKILKTIKDLRERKERLA